MKRTKIEINTADFPARFHPLLTGDVYDSSCSNAARVWFLDAEGGCYLKRAERGALENEALMTRFFHDKGLAAEVLSYESSEYDWLLTRKVSGEDCIHAMYLEDPRRLSDLLGQLLRQLHEEATEDCTICRSAEYLETAKRNFEAKAYDASHFPDNWGYASAEEAWRFIEENGKYLRSDVLLHGDYCLPNIMLDDWRFSAFIDLGGAGLGDRHIDLFWGIWSLGYNLKTDAYRDRFLDAYGRDKVQEEMLRLISACEVFG